MSDIVLKGITWDHSRGYDPLVAASEKYLTQNNIRVKWEKRSLKDFGDQSLEQLASKFDLLIIDHPHSGVANETRCVIPIEEVLAPNAFHILRSQSAGPSFDSYNYKGYQWALPIDAAFQSACFRPDLLNTPTPTNWEEVFALADVLKKNSQYIGMALCPTDALCTFLSLSAQFNAPIKEENEKLIDEKIGIKILEKMARMRDAFHPESLNWNPIQLYDHMAEYDDIVYAPLAFNYTNYSRRGFRKHLLYYADAPNQLAVLGGAGIAISSSCIHKEEAVKYAAWICGDETQKGIYTENKGQPGNEEAWNDRFNNKLTNDFFKRTKSTLDQAYVRPRFAQWPKYQEWLGDTVHEFLSKENSYSVDFIGRINEKFIQRS